MENSKECPICLNLFCQSLKNNDLVHGACFDDQNLKPINNESLNNESLNNGSLNNGSLNNESLNNESNGSLNNELYCKQCSKEMCIMLLPCQHIFCGLCIFNDMMLQKKANHIINYKCSLCRSETHNFIDILVDPETGQKKFKISNIKIPIEFILNKKLFASFVDKLMPLIKKNKFVNMLGVALKPN
jgi:hypothetical protein